MRRSRVIRITSSVSMLQVLAPSQKLGINVIRVNYRRSASVALNIDEINSTGATVSSDGSLKRYLCTLSDSADCAISGLSLNGVANASKYYNRQVNIIYKKSFVLAKNP